MATDVSGTIHIIAEVMGDAGSPIAGTGASAKTSDKSNNEKLKISVFGLAFDTKQIIKYITIGGLIANSQMLTTITNYLFYMLGVLADTFLRPLLPTLLWTMENILKFLTYIGKLIKGEKSFSEVWGDWTGFWTNQWNEVGFLGIIKNLFKLATGMSIFATLIGGLVAGPAGASFMLSSIFKWSGGKFGLDVIANVIGIKKAPKLSEARKGTKAARTARFIKQKALSLGSFIGRVVPIGKALVGVGVIISAFALNSIADKPWDDIVEEIKETFFSEQPITWKSALSAFGLITRGTAISLLHLIEVITFNTVSAEEAAAWFRETFIDPIVTFYTDLWDSVTQSYEEASGFFESFMSSPLTVGRDFMDIVTSPLEVLNREKFK